jgi:hypothetical protein
MTIDGVAHDKKLKTKFQGLNKKEAHFFYPVSTAF